MKIALWFSLMLLLVVFMVAAFVAGIFYGQGQAYGQVRKQFRLDMNVAKEKENALLHELAKARYYYYSNQAHWRLRQGEGDYGPVNEELLKGFSAGKGLTTFKQEYEDYRKITGFAE